MFLQTYQYHDTKGSMQESIHHISLCEHGTGVKHHSLLLLTVYYLSSQALFCTVGEVEPRKAINRQLSILSSVFPCYIPWIYNAPKWFCFAIYPPFIVSLLACLTSMRFLGGILSGIKVKAKTKAFREIKVFEKKQKQCPILKSDYSNTSMVGEQWHK